MKIKILLITLIILVNISLANEHKITGRVIDILTKQPVNATIKSKDNLYETFGNVVEMLISGESPLTPLNKGGIKGGIQDYQQIYNTTETFTDENGYFTLSIDDNVRYIEILADGYIQMELFLWNIEYQSKEEIIFEMIAEDSQSIPLFERDYESYNFFSDDEIGRLKGISVVPDSIKVLMPDNTVQTMNLDEYLKGVVPSEMPASWNMEALKVQAVCARCYASTSYRHPSVGANVCTTTHCQVWQPKYYASTNTAVYQTHGVAGLYNGEIISAYFSAHCDGHTRNIEDVWGTYLPYCRSVECICGFTFLYGHGVGMCQYGSNAYANQGWTYDNILKHYYTGITVENTTSVNSQFQVDNPQSPNDIYLAQNYPNPFSDETVIGYRLSGNQVSGNRLSGNQVIGNQVIGNQVIGNQVIGNQVISNQVISGIADYQLPITNYQLPITDYHITGYQVKLSIYSITGQLVRTLVNEYKVPGEYTIKWDGKDEKGNKVNTGVYLYNLKVGDEYKITKKMILYCKGT